VCGSADLWRHGFRDSTAWEDRLDCGGESELLRLGEPIAGNRLGLSGAIKILMIFLSV